MNHELVAIADAIESTSHHVGFESEDEEVMQRICEFAKANRVLLALYLWLDATAESLPDSIKQAGEHEVRRHELQRRFLNEVAEAARQRNVEFLVFKRKPFPYVGDDIDFLVPSREAFIDFIDLLKNLGLKHLGEGPSAATLTKLVGTIHITADVHRSIAASRLPYVDEHKVWNRKIWCQSDGDGFNVPCVEDELLILAGHSVHKELRINLAELFTAKEMLLQVNFSKLWRIAQEADSSGTLASFLLASNRIFYRAYGRVFRGIETVPRGPLVRAAESRISRVIKSGLELPLSYPASIPIVAYWIRTLDAISRGGRASWDYVRHLLMSPFTNREGIGILVKYLRSQF